MHLLHLVRRTIRRYSLCPPGTRLVIGVSGGSDSVALTLILRELAHTDEFRVAGLAHLNHQLRASAARDEEFCRTFASRLGLGIVVDSIDVQAYAASQRLSREDAARRLRYEFLTRAAEELGADRIAVGHTQDDQAETFLLKLARGAGLTGLGGIYPRRDRVIRPVLDVSRAALRAYVEERGESWVEDETNDDLTNPRNRIRHRVLPELDGAYGAATRPAIARAAALVREDAQWLDELSRISMAELAQPRPDGLEFDATSLSQTPLPIRRRVLLGALRQMAGDREIGLDHIDAVLAVLTGSTSATDVPGVRVELRRGKLVLLQQEGRAK